VNKNILPVIAALLVVTVVAHHGAVENGWTTWDDPLYVTDNNSIREISVENLSVVWTSQYIGSYLPLTMMSYMVDYAIGEYDPRVYHSINLLLHLCNTVLAFLFIYTLSGGKIIASFFVAIVFAVHPMHVESVAWISARKDVLSGLFFFISLITYTRYVQKNRPSLLIISFIAFVFAVLSKVIVIVLPVVLLMIDYYIGKRWDIRLVKEKIPFFVVSAVFVVIGVLSQSAAGAIRNSTVEHSLIVPHYSLYFYLEKYFLPINLSSLYPYPKMTNGFFPLKIYMSIPVVYGVLYAIWRYRTDKNLLFGFLFFMVFMLPVVQIIRFSNIIAADRFTYLAYIGLSLPLGIAIEGMIARYSQKGRMAIAIVVVCVITAMCVMTMERISVWKDSETLWKDVFAKYPDALL
jgi:hypothetical protein